MANDLNQCQFIGRAGKDPEVRYTQSGDPVASLSIAVGESWKDKSGEKKEQTTWVPLVIWGKLAEITRDYVSKGSRIYVSGKFVVRKWQDRDGADRWSTEVKVDRLQLLDPKKDGNDDNHSSADNRDNEYNSSTYEDDIPF